MEQTTDAYCFRSERGQIRGIAAKDRADKRKAPISRGADFPFRHEFKTPEGWRLLKSTIEEVGE